MRDHLMLQAVILAWSLTAILGKLIVLPVQDMIVWRTGLAALGFAIAARLMGKPLRLPIREAWKIMAVGAVLGLHWQFFFYSARVSTASVSLAAMPTLMIWCSLMEPWVTGGKKFRTGELITGAVIVVAICLIYQVEFRHAYGFSLSIIGAALAGVFTISNKRLASQHAWSTLLCWQMIGACASLWIALPFSADRLLPAMPSLVDFGWLLVFSQVCTVAAYAGYVDLLRRMSVFTINVVYNLEPIYGILLAAAALGSAEIMSPGFYWAAALIVGSVIALPVIRRYVE
jgi:drug/metabolite transporter (DMT)-like permease